MWPFTIGRSLEQLITCIMNYAVQFQFSPNALTVLRAKERNPSSIFLPLKQETLSFFPHLNFLTVPKIPELNNHFSEFAALGKETERQTVVKQRILAVLRLTGTLSILTKRTQNDRSPRHDHLIIQITCKLSHYFDLKQQE